MTPQCSNCGHVNASFTSVCTNCGVPLPGAAPQQQPPVWGAPPADAPGYGAPAYGATPFGGMQASMFAPNIAEAQKQARNSLIAGVVGIFCCGLVLGILAIKWGSDARSSLRAAGVSEGQGLATAGMVIGGIDLAFWVLGIIVQIVAN